MEPPDLTTQDSGGKAHHDLYWLCNGWPFAACAGARGPTTARAGSPNLGTYRHGLPPTAGVSRTQPDT